MEILFETIQQYAFHFARAVCLTLNGMTGDSYTFKEEELLFEPFSGAEGIVVFVPFSGSIQGNCILIMTDEVFHRIVTAYHDKIGCCPQPADYFSSAELLNEILNTSMGQLLPYIEREIEAFSYMPPVFTTGKITFPRVKSCSIRINGPSGTVTCVFALNMANMKIVATLKSLSDDLKKQTKLAWLDSLTGLKNRTCFNEMFYTVLNSAGETDRWASIIILDVDNLKTVNDTFGHQTGDRVLVAVAETVMGTLRENDIPCRYGGDEIVIILPDTNCCKAQSVARRIRERLILNSKKLLEQNPRLPVVTLSVGIAQLDRFETPDQLFKRTDAALYMAKKSGRNQIVMSQFDGDNVLCR